MRATSSVFVSGYLIVVQHVAITKYFQTYFHIFIIIINYRAPVMILMVPKKETKT